MATVTILNIGGEDYQVVLAGNSLIIKTPAGLNKVFSPLLVAAMAVTDKEKFKLDQVIALMHISVADNRLVVSDQ